LGRIQNRPHPPSGHLLPKGERKTRGSRDLEFGSSRAPPLDAGNVSILESTSQNLKRAPVESPALIPFPSPKGRRATVPCGIGLDSSADDAASNPSEAFVIWVAEPADKPGSVVDSHSSRRTVTGTLEQPTRTRRGQRHEVPIWSCSRWGLPCRPVTRLAVRSYRTISPLPVPCHPFAVSGTTWPASPASA